MAAQQSGVFGYGIGMTHPALERLRKVLNIPKPRETAPTYDAELGQVLVELGMIGWLAWYLMRVVILFHCIGLFLRVEAGIYRSILLTGILIQALHFFTSLVLNHTANILFFACFGLCLIPTLYPVTSQSRSDSSGVPERRMGRSSLVPTRRGSR